MNLIDALAQFEQFLVNRIKKNVNNQNILIQFYIGTEIEFFINPNINIESIKNDIIAIQPQARIDQEYETNQYEISIPPLDFKDAIITTTNIVEYLKNNPDVLLIPKLYDNQHGCSMQINTSIAANNVSLFQRTHKGISDITYFAIGGLIKHMKESMYLFCPTQECYKRITLYGKRQETECIHYPINISWGINNRTTAIRLPIKGKHAFEDLHIEHRVPSVKCNISQTIVSILYSVVDGIENQIQPPEPIYGNAHDEQYELEPLTKTINKAMQQYEHGNISKIIQQFAI